MHSKINKFLAVWKAINIIYVYFRKKYSLSSTKKIDVIIYSFLIIVKEHVTRIDFLFCVARYN